MRPVVLVLGGTGEARALAATLVADGRDPHDRAPRVVSSLAGRVSRPRLPAGEVRTGGFGGANGLAAWLRAERVACVVDATHPFARRIGTSAATACTATGTPLLRLARQGWAAMPGDDWHRVASLAAAAALLPRLGRRAFLTTGRQGLAAFRDDARTFFLVRTVDPPDPADLPPRHALLLDRGPYTAAGEGALLDGHRLDVVVTKDSGGEGTRAKLDAARDRGLPVVVVERPPRPQVASVDDVAAAVAWVRATVTSP